MERDFLGMNGKDSEDSRGSSRQDSGGSGVQWPFSNKVPSLQQFVSFKPAKEEKMTKVVFDHHSTSGFQPVNPAECFTSNQKQAPKKCFDLDRRGGQKFSFSAYQPVSRHSIPIATSSPLFKVYGSSSSSNLPMTTSKQHFGPVGANNASTMISGVGNLTPRNVSNPSVSTAQLTIFYAGSVNVYDEVPLEKAQEIMFLASKVCNANSNAANQRPQPPAPAVAPKVTGVGYDTTNHVPTQTQINNPVSSLISVGSHVGAQSRSSSSNTDDVAVMKVPPSVSHPEATKTVATSVPVVPRAVPQARKASLARFLEKRKERVTSAMPYFTGQKSSENFTGFDSANIVSKCSSADIARTSNQESWRSGQHNDNSRDSPSTKLEM